MSIKSLVVSRLFAVKYRTKGAKDLKPRKRPYHFRKTESINQDVVHDEHGHIGSVGHDPVAGWYAFHTLSGSKLYGSRSRSAAADRLVGYHEKVKHLYKVKKEKKPKVLRSLFGGTYRPSDQPEPLRIPVHERLKRD